VNLLLRKYFSQIDSAVDEVHQALRGLREQQEIAVAEKDELRKQLWARGREVTVLQEANAQYAQLQEENAALQAKQDAVREHLNRILNHTKALTSEFRP